MKFVTVISLVFLSATLFAQRPDQGKLPLMLRYALKQSPQEEHVHLYLKGDEARLDAFIQSEGGIVKRNIGEYLSVMLSTEATLKLDTFRHLEHIHFEFGQGKPLLSESRIQTNVDDVHSGNSDLPQVLKGSGVIVGVIDAGIELLHPDFQHDDGSTRILELWDQTMSFDATRTPAYGYGQIWDSADINDSICPHQDQSYWFGHGTNTTGIAAGNGATNAQYTGIAPESEIIVVSSSFSALGWTSTVADAIEYIFDRAEFYGKPCVINTSIGTYLGSHDASDLAAQSIEEDITSTTGRIVVAAAGNSGDQDPYHLGYEATADSTFTWFKVPDGIGPGLGSIAFEVYGDVGDFERLKFSVGADEIGSSYSFRGETPFDSVGNYLYNSSSQDLMSVSGNYLGQLNLWADSLNGVYRLQVWLSNIDSVDYNYRFSVTGQGRFDLWSAYWLGYNDMLFENLPDSSVYPAIKHYRLPDIEQSIVSSWTCSDHVITVGNYINRTTYIDVDNQTVVMAGQTQGDIAANSSFGPTRKGILKPEVAAPGDNTLTAGAFFQLQNLMNIPSQRNRVAQGGMHHRAGGTSSAAPVVAGIAALYLEHCSQGDWYGFEDALVATSFEDAFTGQLPNYRWGNGKVDALALLRYASPAPALNYVEETFCAGDSLEVSVSGNFSSLVWNTGDSATTLNITQSNVYYAFAENEAGCTGVSDTLNAFKRPLPAKPIILQEGVSPTCPDEPAVLTVSESFGAYEWNTGQLSSSIEVTESGSYWCTVFNEYNCRNASDTINIAVYPLSPKPTLALNQAGDLVLIVDSSVSASAYQWYVNGESVVNESNVLSNPALGEWSASYTDSNGCTRFAEPILVYALGETELDQNELLIYPNPVRDYLTVQHDDLFDRAEVYAPSGQKILDANIQGESGLNLETLSTGSYFIRFIGSRSSQTISIVKE